MKKIILERQEYGWSAMFFGVPKMPEDIEIPLTCTSRAFLHSVAIDMRNRFPGASLFYRDSTGHVSQVASVCDHD